MATGDDRLPAADLAAVVSASTKPDWAAGTAARTARSLMSCMCNLNGASPVATESQRGQHDVPWGHVWWAPVKPQLSPARLPRRSRRMGGVLRAIRDTSTEPGVGDRDDQPCRRDDGPAITAARSRSTRRLNGARPRRREQLEGGMRLETQGMDSPQRSPMSAAGNSRRLAARREPARHASTGPDLVGREQNHMCAQSELTPSRLNEARLVDRNRGVCRSWRSPPPRHASTESDLAGWEQRLVRRGTRDLRNTASTEPDLVGREQVGGGWHGDGAVAVSREPSPGGRRQGLLPPTLVGPIFEPQRSPALVAGNSHLDRLHVLARVDASTEPGLGGWRQGVDGHRPGGGFGETVVASTEPAR